jgi:hypothetical protein
LQAAQKDLRGGAKAEAKVEVELSLNLNLNLLGHLDVKPMSLFSSLLGIKHRSEVPHSQRSEDQSSNSRP